MFELKVHVVIVWSPWRSLPLLRTELCVFHRGGPLADVDIGCYSSNRGPSDQFFSSHFGGDGPWEAVCPPLVLIDLSCTLSVGPKILGWGGSWAMIASGRWDKTVLFALKKKQDACSVLTEWCFSFFCRTWDWLTTTLIMSETTAPIWPNRTADGLLSSPSSSLEMKG